MHRRAAEPPPRRQRRTAPPSQPQRGPAPPAPDRAGRRRDRRRPVSCSRSAAASTLARSAPTRTTCATSRRWSRRPRSSPSEFFNRLQRSGRAVGTRVPGARWGRAAGPARTCCGGRRALTPPASCAEAQEDLDLAFELRRDGLHRGSRADGGGPRRARARPRRPTRSPRTCASSSPATCSTREPRARSSAGARRGGASGRGPDSASSCRADRDWLDELQLARELAVVAGETGASRAQPIAWHRAFPRPCSTRQRPARGRHAQHARARLRPRSRSRVLNGGTADEVGRAREVRAAGQRPSRSRASGTIPRIKAGRGRRSTVLAVEGEIPEGEELTLIVTVFPVPGETLVDNNEATYQVVFG